MGVDGVCEVRENYSGTHTPDDAKRKRQRKKRNEKKGYAVGRA